MMFFWPRCKQTDKQTDNLFFFIWPSLQSRELIKPEQNLWLQVFLNLLVTKALIFIFGEKRLWKISSTVRFLENILQAFITFCECCESEVSLYSAYKFFWISTTYTYTSSRARLVLISAMHIASPDSVRIKTVDVIQTIVSQTFLELTHKRIGGSPSKW